MSVLRKNLLLILMIIGVTIGIGFGVGLRKYDFDDLEAKYLAFPGIKFEKIIFINIL